MNKYHSFYLADLKIKIREVAMAAMSKPGYMTQTDLADSTIMNANKAFYNDGIRAAAEMIILALEKEAEEKDDTVRD